jgi:MoaA/NifB/PqqE/SkfB family radical SAM enzyme
MYRSVRDAGAVRSISLDLTHECNLRCQGCYYFEEGMDKIVDSSMDVDAHFSEFVRKELARGTNFVTIVGGEPSLRLDRLKVIYDNFKLNVATNGLERIPLEGFEQMPIGVAVWGDHHTDSDMRISGKRDLFQIALDNYKNDPRAFFYYTVAPGNSEEIERVVDECVSNGNRVLFNYYSDLKHLGGSLDYHQGFENVRIEIDRMIDKYPEHIYTTTYFNQIVTTGRLYNQRWGYDVCTNVSTNIAQNELRLANGNPYNPHFRAYNADFVTTRRCCTGINRSCDSCFDAWEHFSWIMINLKKHLDSKEEFTNWLTSMYMFYLINRIGDFDREIQLLPQVHKLLKISQLAG